VGWNGNPQFDQRVFAEVHEASGGIPRRVNQIANRLLLLGAVEERSRIDSVMLRSVLDEMAGERRSPRPRPSDAAPEPRFEPSRRCGTSRASTTRCSTPARRARRADRRAAAGDRRARQPARSPRRARCGPRSRRSGAVARLEAKVFEQERTIRQTLTMLIEWIEGEMEQTKAARAGLQGGSRVNAITFRERPTRQDHRQRPVGRRRGLVPGRRVRERDRARRLGRLADRVDATSTRSSTCSTRSTPRRRSSRSAGSRSATAPCCARSSRAGTSSPATAGTTAACSRWTAELRRGHRAARKAIEDAAGVRVTGYRAPSFSIDQRTPWAFIELAERGYAYSSSVAPVEHDHYGWPEAPRFAFRPIPWAPLVEIPVTTAMFAGKRLAAAAAGSFRVLPYAFSRWAIRQVNRRDERPACSISTRGRSIPASRASPARRSSRGCGTTPTSTRWRPSCAS
jgi:hypothetical protein